MCPEDANSAVPTCNHAFYQNRACEYFPCHETMRPECFNCLFCYCPLYALGSRCGGNFKWLENGVKDCSGCMLPHSPQGYDYIIQKYDDIIQVAREHR